MNSSLPLSTQLDNLLKLGQKQQNKVLKDHGYRWVNYTQDDLDDNDDFDRSPGWYLFSSDHREVDVHDAFEEIIFGLELAKRIRGMESYRASQVKHIGNIFRFWYKSVIDHVIAHAAPPETTVAASEQLYDSRRYGIGYTIRTNGSWLVVTNFHGSDMADPTEHRLGVGSAFVDALRDMQKGVAMPPSIQSVLGLKVIALEPVADQPALPAETPEYMVLFADKVGKLPFRFDNPEACKTPHCALALSVSAHDFVMFDLTFVYLRIGGPYSDNPNQWIADKYWSDNWPYIHVRAPITDEIQAWINANLPEWYDREIHLSLLNYTGMYGKQDEDRPDYPPAGKLGRYKPKSYGAMAHCARDAMRISWLDNVPLNSLTYIDAQLLYSNGGSRFGRKPFSIWTDGPQSWEVFCGEFGEPLSKDATFLVSAAGRQKIWRNNDEWRSFLNITITSRKQVLHDEKGGTGNGMSKTLIELTLSDNRTVWLIEEAQWSMGEDGDASEDHYIYPTQKLAFEEYHSMKLY